MHVRNDSTEEVNLEGQARLPQGRNVPLLGQFVFGHKGGGKKVSYFDDSLEDLQKELETSLERT